MVIRPKRTAVNMTQSTSQAKAWVKTHYERHEDGVVAKAVMYKHYEDFCKLEGRSNMETSIFGRVVKNVFADVTIRRLGGRDNLKYYYCGIRAKETSPHANDNKTTTRPKRRLRKRELVTNKSQVDSCLRWLHSHFIDAPDSSVVKTDVYDRYISDCQNTSGDPLSIQYFGMVVTHAFPHVTKRKLGPRTNQQKYYFGIRERPSPMPTDSVPRDYLSLDSMLNGNRTSYRDASSTHDDEDDEFNCRSPSSDISDQNLTNYEPELQDYHHQYGYGYIKEEVEPVDYSLSSLRLKTEPPEEELMIKCDPSDIQMDRDFNERQTPERPPSVGECMSPLNHEKKSTPRKIYKPRFHFDYSETSSWNDDSRDEGLSQSYYSTEFDPMIVKWITNNFVLAPGVHLNRMQVFRLYEKYCDMVAYESYPLTHFDEIMLKILDGVVTMIHPSGKTFYAGIRVRDGSSLVSSIEVYQCAPDHSSWTTDESIPQVIDMSNSSSPSHSVPLSLEDEEEFHDGYSCVADDESSPQILKDGKFFLKTWLEDNFAPANESCVLKAEAYKHYEAYARSINQTPFEMNVFGKIVWQVFPDVTVRRLGGRSKPQYHYCGITVKPSSPLFHVMSGKDPAQRSRKKEIATDNRSAEIVIDWLKQNYEAGKNKILTKSDVFCSYTKYCASINENPVNLNYFGKLLKHCFAGVEVRKFGGRSDPTWCYLGLAPRESSSMYHLDQEMSTRDNLPYLIDMRTAHSSADSVSPMPPVSRDSPHHLRQPTNPIPISDSRVSPQLLGTPTGTSFGSPTLFQDHHLSVMSSKLSPSNHGSPRNSYESHSKLSLKSEASHLDGNFFRDQKRYRRSPFETSDVPTDLGLSRSPIESESHGSLLYGSNIPREHLLSSKFASHFGGQVVPSQTPPSLVPSSSVEANVAALMQAQFRHKKSLNSDMFAYNEIIDGAN